MAVITVTSYEGAPIPVCFERNHWTDKYDAWVGYAEFGVVIAIYLWMVWD